LLATFTQLIEGRFEASRQFVGGTSAPIVEEDYDRSRIRHVVVDGYNLQAVSAKSLEGSP
jgi:hypothetical protein